MLTIKDLYGIVENKIANEAEKIKLYLEYVEKHNFFYDLGLIFRTFWVIVKER